MYCDFFHVSTSLFRNCLKFLLVSVSLKHYPFLFSYRKKAPPSKLNALVNDYNDGFLLNYLDPREHARSLSPLPWALRATAPTDHNLAQRVIDTETDSTKTFTLPKYLNDKHQIAVDASGLEMNLQYYDFGLLKIQRNKMTLLMAFVIVLGLCIGATVLNSTPIHDDIPEMRAEMDVTQTKKASAGIDAKKKQVLLDFMNEANKSFPKEGLTPKKTDLFDFINVNIAGSTKDKPNPSSSSKATPPVKKIVKDSSKEMLESDSVKQPVVDSEKTATTKTEDAPPNEDTKAKQKPNILRAVKNLIRSAICALRNKCE